MKDGDVMVLQVQGESDTANHYLIGVLRRREAGDTEEPLYFEDADNDRDRMTAFAKARQLAGGRNVYFNQRLRPGFLQDHYNSVACPKCGMYTSGVQLVAFGNGAQSIRCHACQHAIEIRVVEP